MAATPASRDRVVDAARALCIVVVTLWHWTLSVTHRTADGSLAMPNPIHAVPGGWLATWVLQIMPVFFLVGGYANLVGWQRAQVGGTTAGQGVTSPDGKRAAPSAGALYPLELYVVTPDQVMHYLPDGHRAETRVVSDLRPGLKDAAVGQSTVGAAPVVIVVAAVPGRLSDRYGSKAEAFVQIEVGHAAQNILLQAAALELAAVPVGSLDPSWAADTLALPTDQTVLYLIPVGRVPLTDRPHAPMSRPSHTQAKSANWMADPQTRRLHRMTGR